MIQSTIVYCGVCYRADSQGSLTRRVGLRFMILTACFVNLHGDLFRILLCLFAQQFTLLFYNLTVVIRLVYTKLVESD